MIKNKQLNSKVRPKIEQSTPFKKKKLSQKIQYSIAKPTFSSRIRSNSAQSKKTGSLTKQEHSPSLTDRTHKIKHSKTMSNDLLDHYNKMLDISRQLNTKHNFTLQSSQEDQCIPFTNIKDQIDLFCNEDLSSNAYKRGLFENAILTTPVHHQNRSIFQKYHSNQLAVVEQRIISEEEKEYISDKKLKRETPRYNQNNQEGALKINQQFNSANTAATSRQAGNSFNKILTAFEPGTKKLKININVNQLVHKSKLPKILLQKKKLK